MRSALFTKCSLPLLLMFTAAVVPQGPPNSKVNPHTQIRWPASCSGPGKVYNWQNNTCLDMNSIDPSHQLNWPTNCNAANMIYSPALNTCIANGTAANPAGNPNDFQINLGGVFGPATGVSFIPGIGGLNAGSLNGVYDIRAQFGASASTATMSCTVTSGSSSLTCSGGTADFKVNQWVVLKNAGSSPTVSAPTGLALTCANTHIGTYLPSATYPQNQTILYSGIYYISLQNGNTGNTPSSSPTWWSGNGTACPPAPSSTVTYSYKVVQVQGAPNGALSAPSAAVNITMSQPIQQSASNSNQPDLYAQLSWTGDGTNSAGYLIYRSVNGGPYNFYYMIDYHFYSLNDYNTYTPAIMTCADLDVPCTVPSGTTPNDVYAVITAISGTTVTIATRTNPYQPVFASGTGFTGAYPSVPAVSGSVTVEHDDMPATELMRTALTGPTDSPQVKVHFPPGTYNLHAESKFAGWQANMHLGGLHNVVLEGNGDTTVLLLHNDRSLRFARGIFATCGEGNISANHCTGFNMGGSSSGNFGGGGGTAQTNYKLLDPVPAGTTTVYTPTPGDAANLTAGMYVTIQQTTANWSAAPPLYPTGYPKGYRVFSNTSGNHMYLSLQDNNLNHPVTDAAWWQAQGGNDYPYEYYGELNRIVSADSTTGTVQLMYPTTKQYSEKITTLPYSQCVACSATPVIAPVGGTVEASGITIRNFKIRGHVYGLFGFNAITDNMTIENNSILTSTFNNLGTSRHVIIRNNTVQEDGYIVPSGIINEAAAMADTDVLNNNFHGTRANGSNQFCTEGTTNLVVKGNTMAESGVGTNGNGTLGNNTAILAFTGMCFNSTVTENKISLTQTGQSWFSWWDNNAGGVTVAHNDIYIDSVSSGASGSSISSLGNASVGATANPQYHSYDNKWRIGNFNTANFLNAGGAGVTNTYGTMWAPFNIGPTQTAFAGSFSISRWQNQYTMLPVTMAGNITQVQFGQVRYAGTYFAIDFIQAASGGPYTVPSTCADSGWLNNGLGILCPNGPPVIQTAANSHTIMWFYDDGTNIHLVDNSYMSPTVVQTNQSNTYTTGTQDFGSAAHTMPARRGTTAAIPATCTVGEEYFATDATAGSNKYFCTATNTWTQVTPGGTAGYGRSAVIAPATVGSAGLGTTLLKSALPAAGTYRLCGSVDAIVAGTSGSALLRVSFTSDGHAFVAGVTPNVNATPQWTIGQGCYTFYADSGSTINYDVTSSAAGSVSYRYSGVLEQLQ